MNNEKWLKSLFIIVFIFAIIPYTASYLYLKSIYENNSYEEIVKRQIRNNSIYGTALNQNTYKYKLELIKQTKPEIIALGSSRVMQFREESFNKSFITAGGAMNHLNEGLLFLEQMYKYHKPKYIILGLDFWWFNDQFSQPSTFPYHLNNGKTINGKKVFKTQKFLVDGKVDLNTTKYIINNNSITNNYTNYDNLGFSAIRTSDGFRKDGSYFYSKTIFGIEPANDIKFNNTFNRIKKGKSRFEFGKQMSLSRKKILENIISITKKFNSKLIIVIPPVANEVRKSMDSKKYAFLEEFEVYIENLNIENFNYHNLSKLTRDDCECIDGFHGGDIVYKRILLDIYNLSKDQKLKELINIKSIKSDIAQFKGKVLTVKKEDKFKLNEVNFLDLDCSNK